jgi:hypothetical protein
MHTDPGYWRVIAGAPAVWVGVDVDVGVTVGWNGGNSGSRTNELGGGDGPYGGSGVNGSDEWAISSVTSTASGANSANSVNAVIQGRIGLPGGASQSTTQTDEGGSAGSATSTTVQAGSTAYRLASPSDLPSTSGSPAVEVSSNGVEVVVSGGLAILVGLVALLMT